MNPLLQKLKAKNYDRTSSTEELERVVKENYVYFNALFEGIYESDAIISSRAADLLDKVSLSNPELLNFKKPLLLNSLDKFSDKEVIAHIAPILSRLSLSSKREVNAVASYLTRWLYEKCQADACAKSSCFEALAQLARKHTYLSDSVKRLLEQELRNSKAEAESTPEYIEKGEGILLELGMSNQVSSIA